MSKKRFELLSEAQWELIELLLPEPRHRKDKRGRPWASNRALASHCKVAGTLTD
jgi:hypothetical protein